VSRKKKSPFPERLFVVEVELPHDDSYLSAQRTVDEAFDAHDNDPARIAEYRLVGFKTATRSLLIKDSPKRAPPPRKERIWSRARFAVVMGER